MDSEIRHRLDGSFNLVREIPLEKLRVLERSKKSIKDLAVGSVLVYENITYLVTDKYQYYKKKKDVLEGEEYQITNVLTGEVRYIEYSEDDTVEIFVTTSQLSAKEIHQIIGNTNNYRELENIYSFPYKGEIGLQIPFFWDDSWKNRFVRANQTLEDAEVVAMVEYESKHGNTYITFEFWGDSVEAFASKEIEAHQLEILSI